VNVGNVKRDTKPSDKATTTVVATMPRTGCLRVAIADITYRRQHA
jgi:hypothetical protein